jgi:hypothetical protein
MPSFLDLPAKLRTQIYDLVFDASVLTIRPSRPHVINGASLLLANRQIHSETRLLPYYRQTFWLFCHEGLVEFFRARSQAQLAAIQSLVLYCAAGSCFRKPVVQDFAILGGVVGLERIQIVQRGGTMGQVEGQSEELVGLVRTWLPEAEIGAKRMVVSGYKHGGPWV